MEDTGCKLEDALVKVYQSPVLEALQDEEGELYVQSPAYIYDMMNTTPVFVSQRAKGAL
ncbi:MAG: hypothetical protein IJ634_00185 [Bacteroidales bacterium]|nr:hypothetical protein [Bacteroidales bacterium]